MVMQPTSSASLGRIVRVDAREIWKHEAHEFTPWLLEHIDQLNEAIGFEIELSGKEESVGPFAVDLFGKEVQTGHYAIIENQLEDTDHRHLGQLLTYASGLSAGVIVWIAPHFRPEHRNALTWLNEVSSESVNFFGIELEILDINGQKAPNFKLVAEPNAWQKSKSLIAQGAGSSPGASQRMLAYQEFFENLLTQFKRSYPNVTSASKAQPQSYLSIAAGKAGSVFAWSFTADGRFKVELTVDTLSRDKNVEAVNWIWSQFDLLQLDRSAFVLDIAEPRRAQRISTFAPWGVGIGSPDSDLDRLTTWAVDAMGQLTQSLRPLLKQIPD